MSKSENKKEVSPVMIIGNIGNYYGGLNVKSDDSKYYWAIENHNGYDWEEITEKLYNALIEFEERGVDSVFYKTW